ncbi:MAG: MFS transporter [Chloroflexi bacterium]|nr:MFS transporter [Chloroflexota bacterium]
MAKTEIEHSGNVTGEVTHGARSFSLGKLKTFSSLANPVFRHYYVSNLCQQAAQNMQQITRALLVYRVTGSATALGVVSLAGALPHIVAALFGGAVADRIQKKYILIFGMVAFSLVALNIAIFLTLGILNKNNWWILVVNSMFQSSLMGILVPARQSILREIVGKEGLMNAVSLNTMAANTWTLMAPAAAGFLIDYVGFEVVFYIMAGLYALGAIFMFFLPHKGSMVTHSSQSPLQNVVEGLKYIRSDPNLLFILVFTLFGIILAMPYQQLLAVYVDKILIVGGKAVGAKGMGVMRSITGVGGIATSLILASLPSRRRGIIMLIGSMTLALALIVFAFSRSWALSLGIMVIVGIGQTMRQTASNTLAMHYAEDRFRGRVMGVYDMQMSFTALGTYVAAVLTDTLNGPQWAIGGFAITLALISLAALVFAPRLRKLD